MSLPPISETQVVGIALLMLIGGAIIGFILGSLWMEQRMQQRSRTLKAPAVSNGQDAEGDEAIQLPAEEPAPGAKSSSKRYQDSA